MTETVPGYPTDGVNEGPSDHRREHTIGKLLEYFPSGGTDSRARTYIKDLRSHRFAIRDVREGVERVIATREQATFPPFAVLLRCCNEARADRAKAVRSARAQGREVDESSPRWNLSAEDVRKYGDLFSILRREDLPDRASGRGVNVSKGGYDDGESIGF